MDDSAARFPIADNLGKELLAKAEGHLAVVRRHSARHLAVPADQDATDVAQLLNDAVHGHASGRAHTMALTWALAELNGQLPDEAYERFAGRLAIVIAGMQDALLLETTRAYQREGRRG